MENHILKCRLESDKKWSEMDIEIQKVKDDIEVITARLNKQAILVQDIQELSKSVALLANNMDGMLKEQKRQNERLHSLEEKPRKRIDNVFDTIIKVIVTAVLGVILMKIGLQ